ncbi:MAG: hypothetical protein ACOVQT_08510 [Rubrivivax sp.]
MPTKRPAAPPPAPSKPTALAAPRRPERWSVDAGDAALATLVLPADAHRERRFEIACAMTVRVPAAPARSGQAMWHEMTVHANGEQQWQRRVPTHAEPEDEGWDGLDVRFVRVVPVGRALKVVAKVAGAGVQRRSLVVEADELLPDPPSAPGPDA